jgi:hypothetical protein
MSDALLSEIPEEYHEKVLTVLLSEAINHTYLHPVSLDILHKEFPLKTTAHIQERLVDYKYHAGQGVSDTYYICSISDLLGWNSIILSQSRLVVNTKQTDDPDPNSNSCYKFNIPKYDFEWAAERKGGILLSDLTEGVYLMKGSKYDYTSETVQKVEIIEKTDEAIQLRVTFEYSKKKPVFSYEYDEND